MFRSGTSVGSFTSCEFDGSYCLDADIYQYLAFVSPTGSDATVVILNETFWSAGLGFGQRWLNCTIDGADWLTGNKSGAELAQLALHPGQESCQSGGYKFLFGWYTEPWVFADMTLAAEWLHPRTTEQETSRVSTNSHGGPVVHYNCRGVLGYDVTGGGFSIDGVFTPYGTSDSGFVIGAYGLESCLAVGDD